MAGYLVLISAGKRIDNLYQTSLDQWGVRQANDYIEGLFHHFEKIVSRDILLKPIAAEFKG